MIPRIDVFSAKGGVGKTTLSFLLAQAQTQHEKRPVLLVDADLTGTCVGDLLQRWATPRWHSQHNLVHLVCGSPERLDDDLRQGWNLPVYEYAALPERGSEVIPVRQDLTEPKLLFCPSHPGSKLQDQRPIPPAVLHALLGHESAGGWVNHVIQRVIEATHERVPALAAVVVDHGPGIGALQRATLDTIRKSTDTKTKTSQWAALVVTTRNYVDLAAVGDLESELGDFSERVTWVINRVPTDVNGSNWREAVVQELDEGIRPEGQWFTKRSIPVHHNDVLAGAYACSALDRFAHNALIEPLRVALFGE